MPSGFAIVAAKSTLPYTEQIGTYFFERELVTADYVYHSYFRITVLRYHKAPGEDH